MACCRGPDGQLDETVILFQGFSEVIDPEAEENISLFSGSNILAHFENKPGPRFRELKTKKLQKELRGKR